MTKSKDTVMPLEYSVLDGLHCAGISNDKILLALRKQANISFKAGIKEVVEWIEENGGPTNYYHSMLFPSIYFNTEHWQAKLKEWGLDDEKH